jgi:hypothetical protein
MQLEDTFKNSFEVHNIQNQTIKRDFNIQKMEVILPYCIIQYMIL